MGLDRWAWEIEGNFVGPDLKRSAWGELNFSPSKNGLKLSVTIPVGEGQTVITPLRLLAIAALAALSACGDLTSDKPLGGSSANHADAHLIGVWKLTTNTEPGQAGYLFMSPRKDGSALHAVFMGWSATQPTERLEFDVTTGVAGGNTFVNIDHLVEADKPAEKMPPGYLPFVYRFAADGTLVIYDQTDDGMKLIKAAIDKHRLAGKVTMRNIDAKTKAAATMDIHLSSDQRTIDAFFAANAKAIFTDKVDTFAPVKAP